MSRLSPHEIGGHVEHNGTSLDLGAVEGAGDIHRDCLGRAHLLKACACRFDDLALVNALEVARVGDGGVASKEDHGDMTAGTFCEGCHAVCQGWAVCHGGDADLACDMGIGEGHEHRAALVCSGHKTSRTVADKAVDHEEIGVAHKAEDCLDAVVFERLCDVLIDVGFDLHVLLLLCAGREDSLCGMR